jgi:hypothetical protein
VEPGLQAWYMETTEARTIFEKLGMAYKVKLKFFVFQIQEELLGIRLKDYNNIDTYALWIDEKVKDYNLCSNPSSANATRTLGNIIDEDHLFYPCAEYRGMRIGSSFLS